MVQAILGIELAPINLNPNATTSHIGLLKLIAGVEKDPHDRMKLMDEEEGGEGESG